ncbi:hypothetical protein E2I00_007517 [Balaenoptera physalus]|uniref:Uncharacterized protein n=1 Tax=Balaenoptera physalus TaxID=9770 RepID=A0A643C4K3_BALPH|nr:hypothetical protein E2I00_007517 [Balaenoptera physalus]
MSGYVALPIMRPQRQVHPRENLAPM